MAAVASRYAKALMDVVMEQNIEPAMALQQLHDMVATIEQSADLLRVWETPGISSERKRALLDAIAQQARLIKPIRNFFAVLIDHGRIPMVAQIARQFETELNNELGFVEADITSSRPLSQDEKHGLESQVAQLTGKTVRAKYDTNPELLGGAVVRVSSTIFDGSVRGQLQKLREQLASSP